MEPTRYTQTTLVDLLDRVLDRGLILDADLIINVAGIPLLGLKLKAALAGMETMLNYGMWHDWDAAQRATATEEQRRRKQIPLLPGEEVRLKVFASQRHSKGIYHSWRPGYLYITDRRIFLFRKEPAEILFQALYEEIKGVIAARNRSIGGKQTDFLYLLLSTGEVTQLRSSAALVIEDTIEERMKALGLEPEIGLPLPIVNETPTRFPFDEEEAVSLGEYHIR